jgi:HEAT repeat protein
MFDPDELVRWRAVEAAGRLAAIRAREDLEPVREMLRRTLWLMNDESGGLLWLGPQVIGAVLAYVPALRGESLAVLASFLEEEPFRVGVRWALWRVALSDPTAVAAAAARQLAASLADPDPAVRGHAALALSAAAAAPAAVLARDEASFVVFDPRSGGLRATTVREVAIGAF